MLNLKIRAFDFLLKDKKNLVGAEIGVFKGGHAFEMLKFLDIKIFYLVEPYRTYIGHGNKTHHPESAEKVARALLQRYQHKVIWIKSSSVEAVAGFQDKSLDFVYIDGNHDYKFALQDIELWTLKVKQGGIIGGHDYGENFPGVEKAIEEYSSKNKIEYKTNFFGNEKVNTDWAFKKGGKLEVWKVPRPEASSFKSL